MSDRSALSAANPKENGFAMPAEWSEHSRCWMAWPSNPAIWTRGMDYAFRNFAHVVQTILQFEPVTLLVNARDRAEAQRLCGDQVEYWEYSLDDSWMRDFGPTFVVKKTDVVKKTGVVEKADDKGELAGIDWRFNGWGKYPFENDQHVARFILDRLNVARIEAPFVLEGGSIHVDGEGTVLTTEQCLLHPNRNPELNKQEIEKLLLDYLGAQQVIWLPEGIADDDTDGHIDEIACFAAPGMVLALVANEKSDIDFAPLQRNADMLREARDARGRKLDVITLEQPEVVMRGAQRLSQSYINFYIANDGVVMPAFGDRKRDEQARGVIAELFPRRKVVQIPARELAYGGGNVHCITQQQPKV